MSLIKSFD